MKFHTTPKSTKLHAVTNDEKKYRTSHQLETFGVYKNNAIYIFFKNLEINEIIKSMTQELIFSDYNKAMEKYRSKNKS